jgi:hypothetical protein
LISVTRAACCSGVPPQSAGGSASPSGSRITTALSRPRPAAKPSIQAWYSAVFAAPPAEYCEQSRPGTLYAASTGTWPRSRALRCSAATSARVCSGDAPPVNQVATGQEASFAIRSASPSRPARASVTACRTALLCRST